MIVFHRLLIGTAIVFCGGFALWAYRLYQVDGGLLYRGLAAGFAGAGLLLSYYLANLRRFLRLPTSDDS